MVYSTNKGKVFGLNLTSDGLKSTNLGSLFQQLESAKNGDVIFVDVGLMDGKPVMFAGAPIYNGPIRAGTLIYEIPFTLIKSIMTAGSENAKGEETYLVGPDKLMRSDSQLEPETHSVKASLSGTVAKNGVDTEAVRKALAGESGTALTQDYRGEKVLSSYAPLNIGGVKMGHSGRDG